MTPVITLAALGLVGAALIAAGLGRHVWWLLAVSAGIAAGLALLKAVAMAGRSGTWDPVFLARAFAVALTYDLARALALVTAAPHHRHTTAPPPVGHAPR